MRRAAPGEPSRWFLAPALAVYLLVVIGPSLAGSLRAFTDWDGLGGSHFVGLENFRTLLADDGAMAALRNTVAITVFLVVVQMTIGLVLALGLHSRIRSRRALEVLFVVPAVISPIVVSFLWKQLLSPGADEGLNGLLGLIGLGGLRHDWLGDPTTALWAIGVTAIWQQIGLSTVIFLAALRGIPDDVLEAAELDGASPFERFRHVVLPLLAPAATINVLLATIGGLKLFDQVFAITGGGPGHATETLSTLVFDEAFTRGHYGYATAIALVLSILVGGVALIQLHVLRRRELG